jgi:hypothetical protein
MGRGRGPRKAPKRDSNPLDRYSPWDIRIARVFYYSIIVASLVIALGIWGLIFDVLLTTGQLEKFLDLHPGFQIAIIGGTLTLNLILLVLFYTLFRGGIVKLSRILFKDKKVAKKYEDFATLRWLIAVMLLGAYITGLGLIIALLPEALWGGLIELWVWMWTNFSVWQWILYFGISIFIWIAIFFVAFYLWNHFVYVILKRVKQIEEELEIEETIKREELKDADEETLKEKYHKDTGKNAIYRGKETKGYKQWKKKMLG